jgi:hypothetical protein
VPESVDVWAFQDEKRRANYNEVKILVVLYILKNVGFVKIA